MVESCSQIAGACLEQSSWLRRNVSVREDELSVANYITEKDIEKGSLIFNDFWNIYICLSNTFKYF